MRSQGYSCSYTGEERSKMREVIRVAELVNQWIFERNL